jgi:3-oxoacyl-[acyl-carrier-protein] synthase II
MNWKEVVVTGLGIVCATGTDTESFRRSLAGGRCGIGPVDLFDLEGYTCKVGGQVRSLPADAGRARGDFPRRGRCAELGCLAAEQAIRESGLSERGIPPKRIGVVLGAGAAGVWEAERYRRQLYSGESRPRPSLLMPFPAGHLTDLIANLYGFMGARSTVTTACSSSATAVGAGADLIRGGRADAVIVGGAEALAELTFSGFNSLRSLDPSTCRPFDRERRGLVLGEGAAMLVLESRDAAAAGGVGARAAVLGWGVCADAHHITAPDPEGAGAERAMRRALENARLSPEDPGYVNAHGTGTPVNDRTEARAIRRLFGKRAPELPVSSTKSAVGHCLGAAGAVEAVATVLALEGGFLPPTLNFENPDPECELDCVPNAARKADFTIALSNSFAFGGNNTTVVFGRID